MVCILYEYLSFSFLYQTKELYNEYFSSLKSMLFKLYIKISKYKPGTFDFSNVIAIFAKNLYLFLKEESVKWPLAIFLISNVNNETY